MTFFSTPNQRDEASLIDLEPEPLDGVQLAINHAGAIAVLMRVLLDSPGWSKTTPADLYDQAIWLLGCRRNYRDGKWSGLADRGQP